jgi:hypothetical protein
MQTGQAALNGNLKSRQRICDKAQVGGCTNETWALARMILAAENGYTNHTTNEGN